jgi:hypothetical protein
MYIMLPDLERSSYFPREGANGKGTHHDIDRTVICYRKRVEWEGCMAMKLLGGLICGTIKETEKI